MGTSSAFPHETLPHKHTPSDPCPQPSGEGLLAPGWAHPVLCSGTWVLRPTEHTIVGFLLVLGPEWLVIYMNRRVVPRHVLVKLKDAEESENPVWVVSVCLSRVQIKE